MPRPDTSTDLEPIYISVAKAADMLGIKPWAMYNQVLNDPECPIDTRFFGRRRLVSLESLRKYAGDLPTERPEKAS